MAGPSHVTMGDLDEPTRLPETEVNEQMLDEERKMAKYSKTAEYKRLENFMRDRIKFHQRYLPSGELVELDPKGNLTLPVPRQDLTAHWVAACIVIKEFENVLAEYERSREVVKEHETRQNDA